jgi:hypothetical protein
MTEDVNDWIWITDDDYIPLEGLEGHEDFIAYDGTVYPHEPHMIIGSGKYQVHVDNWSDECTMFMHVDMYGIHAFFETNLPMFRDWDDWKNMYQRAFLYADRMAIDYVMRTSMIDQGFRTFTGYGYDYEGWELVINWDFYWIFVPHGASAIRPDLWKFCRTDGSHMYNEGSSTLDTESKTYLQYWFCPVCGVQLFEQVKYGIIN